MESEIGKKGKKREKKGEKKDIREHNKYFAR